MKNIVSIHLNVDEWHLSLSAPTQVLSMHFYNTAET